MTAAQIRAAYDLVERAALMDNEIVSLMEIGSEGAVLRFGNASMADGVLIARDGTYPATPTPATRSVAPFTDRRQVSQFAFRGDIRALLIRTRHHARMRCHCEHCSKIRRPWTWRLRRRTHERDERLAIAMAWMFTAGFIAGAAVIAVIWWVSGVSS